MENLKLNGLNHSIAYLESKGLAKCFEAYATEATEEEICEIGFNANSGYVYIALENGIQICSMLGNDVEYVTYDFDNGEEHFHNSYNQAIKCYL
jgi:hypothetical protein